MGTPRDDVWTSPAGARPDREVGEPPFALVATVTVALVLAATTLLSLTGPLLALGLLPAVGVLAGLALVHGTVGAAVGRRRDPETAYVADLALALAVLHLGPAAGLLWTATGASTPASALAGALVAAPVALALYARVRRTWLLVTTVAAVVTALLAAVALAPDAPGLVDAAYLWLVAGFLGAGVVAGWVRPAGSGTVLAVVVAVAGAQVALQGTSAWRYALALAVLTAVVGVAARARTASVLPAALLGGMLLLPQALGPALSGWHTFLVSAQLVGTGVAVLAVRVQRRSPRPVQTGGVLLVCALLVLTTGPVLTSQREAPIALLGAASLLVFFAAAAAARRRPAAVVAGLFLVLSAPEALAAPLGGGVAAAVLAQGLLAVAAVVLGVQLDRRAPAFPTRDGAEDWLSRPGVELELPVPYPHAFDTAVQVATAGGLVVHVLDRAAGRLVAGLGDRPLLGMAVWAVGAGEVRLRVVGAPGDVDLFRRQYLAALPQDVVAPL